MHVSAAPTHMQVVKPQMYLQGLVHEDMYQYFSTILYVHFRNSREGKSTSGVGNPCAPHPLNKSLLLERLCWLTLAKCTVLIRGNFSSVHNLIYTAGPASIHVQYTAIASSPGPFPAFQCYMLKLKNWEGLGTRVDCDVLLVISLSYMYTYWMLLIRLTGITQHLEIKRHQFFTRESEIRSG